MKFSIRDLQYKLNFIEFLISGMIMNWLFTPVLFLISFGEFMFQNLTEQFF